LKRQKNIVISAKLAGIPNIMVISIISILVLNAGLAPMHEQQSPQAYASATISKTSDLWQKIKQYTNQQNTCHRGNDRKQADESQQVQGKDNSEDGFNDQSDNRDQSTTPTAPIKSTPTPTQTTDTLTVTKNVGCNFTLTVADCPTANQFNIKVLTGNGSSLIFNGSGSGILLKINPPFPAAYHTAD
jgi:hypothetical protein